MPVRKATFGLCVVLIGSILYLLLHYVANSIHNAVKQAYMDEIFHVPQAQLYCHGNFTYYHPKLTTPPGLYLISYLRVWIRDKILYRRTELICDIIDLRRTNHLIAVINFVILVLIQLTLPNRLAHQMMRKQLSGFKQRIIFAVNQSTTYDLAYILFTSIAISLLPPLFFFNSLFYTDAGSLLFTLTAYLLSINDHHLLASLSGVISIMFRQTNVVWLFYIACTVILRTYEEYRHSISQKDGTPPPVARHQDIIMDHRFILLIFKRCLPYALVGIGFMAFVIVNKGIVLGDRDAHQPRLHIAQMLYFMGFCAVFGSSWIFQTRILRRFLYLTVRSPLTEVVASALIIYIIAYGRYAHPYLLADNRHITFYIWRRILDRHNSYVPYLLTPIYLLSSLSIWHHFRYKGCKQTMLFIFCTIMVTVPNGLLELRYFIIPYVILRLNIESGAFGLFAEIAKLSAINIGMHHLFLHKTFHWADSQEIQRIMW